SDRLVVVAAHRDRALPDQLHHGIDRPFGIAAVTHEIAEQDHPLHTAGARRLEASLERLPVGMDVGEQGQQHAIPPASNVTSHMAAEFEGNQACAGQSGPATGVYCSSLGGIRGGSSGVNDTPSPAPAAALNSPVEASPPEVCRMVRGRM